MNREGHVTDTLPGTQGETARAQDCIDLDVLVVIVCYRAADLVIDCLRSLEPEISTLPRARVVVCENGTGDDSAQMLQEAIGRKGWSDWVSLKVIYPNRGFAGGNNVVLRDALASATPPRYCLLLNADTVVRAGAVCELLQAAEAHPEAGIISPRLEWPDGAPQRSCFNDFYPLHEFYAAAGTGVLRRLTGAREISRPVNDASETCEWTSFACALIRREVFEQIGVLDDGFFLYFDDPDFCRRARAGGWTVLHWPASRVVHLRGRSNPVKEMTAERRRRPSYWYESRARYYAKHYGWWGLLSANVAWWLGRCVSLAREAVGNKAPHVCEREWLDIWSNWRRPLNGGRSVQEA